MPAPEASSAPTPERGPDAGGVLLAAALTLTAGFVDAVAFLGLGGVFASFMSGDTTRLAVGLAAGAPGEAVLYASVVALFVTGAALGRALAVGSSPLRRSAVLALVGLLLGGAAVAGRLGADAAALVLAVVATGAQNGVIHRAGSLPVTVSYVTGALVRVGEGLADMALGRAAPGLGPNALLWLGLAAGAALGALAFARWGVAALAVPAALVLALSAALALPHARPARSAP